MSRVVTAPPARARVRVAERARRRGPLAVVLVSALLAAASPAPEPPPAAGPTAFLPLEEIRAGMQGKARTVFEGDTLEEFNVEILGVLKNAIGPQQDMIIARLHGDKVEYTGVVSGMSGGPRAARRGTVPRARPPRPLPGGAWGRGQRDPGVGPGTGGASGARKPDDGGGGKSGGRISADRDPSGLLRLRRRRAALLRADLRVVRS